MRLGSIIDLTVNAPAADVFSSFTPVPAMHELHAAQVVKARKVVKGDESQLAASGVGRDARGLKTRTNDTATLALTTHAWQLLTS